jgi:hypothetical protein
MEKELKDFIHLYLGCEGELKTKRTYGSLKRSKQVLTTELLDRLFKLPTVLYFTPFLRKLSDMTDEELKNLRSERGNLKGVERADMNYIIRLNTWSPEDVHYLLSLHFDIFGLIESGLAIDSKTLKEKK